MFIVFLLFLMASYLALYTWIRRDAALDKSRLREQLARLEWPPEDVRDYLRQHRVNRQRVFKTLHYGAVIALCTCAAATLVA